MSDSVPLGQVNRVVEWRDSEPLIYRLLSSCGADGGKATAYADLHALQPLHTEMNTLIVHILSSLIVFTAAYLWLLKPLLPQLDPSKVLIAVLLLHSLRHLGLMFLTTGVVSPAMPSQFAIPAAAGDTVTAALALLAAFLVTRRSRFVVPAVWTFTVVGVADFAMAIGLSRYFSAGDYLGGAYWIPALWVPMLIVGHVIVIVALRQMTRIPIAFEAVSGVGPLQRNLDCRAV